MTTTAENITAGTEDAGPKKFVPPPRPGGARIFRLGALCGFFAVALCYLAAGFAESRKIEAPATHPVTGRSIALAEQAEIDRLRYLDVTWYLDIAQNGYQVEADGRQPNVAFFPLWPFLMRATSQLTGAVPARCGAVMNALLLMLAAGGTALAAHRFRSRGAVEEENDDGRAGMLAVAMALALVVHPMAIFEHALYPESLFLALLAALIVAQERGRLALIAAAAFLLALTRPQGLFVPIAFVLRDALSMILRRKFRVGKDTLAAVLGAGLGVALFAMFMDKLTGDPWAFYRGQDAWYHRELSLWNIPRAFWPEIDRATLLPKAILYFGVGGAVLLWRRGERLTACLVAVFLVIPLRVGDFGDYQRYSLPAIYAVYPWLEKLSRRPLGLAIYFAVSALLAGVFLARFVSHAWVG